MPPAIDRAPSARLGQVLLRQHLWLLGMLLLTATLSGAWIHTWQQASAESLRINAMMREAQRLYRDVYRQAREAVIASQAPDALSVTQYWEHVYDMDARFARLEQQLRGDGEQNAVAGMRHAYGMMQTQINVLLTERTHVDSYKLIDAAVERWVNEAFADAYSSLARVLDERNEDVSMRLHRWNRWASWIFPVPVAASILLVVLAHRRLKRIFSVPMQSLSEGAIAMSHGDLDHRVPESGVTETRSLAASINRMAGDLSQARELLLEQERQSSLERLVPIVAHNIRNPLASIRAIAQASHPDDDTEEREESRQAIISTVDRLEHWTASLLGYLHPFQPRMGVVDTHRLLNELRTLTQPQAATRGVEIRVESQNDLMLQADAQLLEQALHGLLINALEASPTGSTVTLVAREDGDRVAFHVMDHGPGIAFQPDVHQQGPGPSTKTHGTGIGIPFALRVCQAHRGRMHFMTPADGGTRVTLHLPRSQQAAADE